MPKLKPSAQEESNRIVRAYIAYGVERQHINDERLAALLGVTRETVRNKLQSPGAFKLDEVQRMAKALKFTPVQAAGIVLGRELTSKELKDFILM